MTHRCDPAIGSQPMGTPDVEDIRKLLETVRMQNMPQEQENQRSTLIANTASRILQAMIFHEPTANKHVITHYYDTATHRLRLSGSIYSRNMADNVTSGTIMRTLADYAKKIRQSGPRIGYRLKSSRHSDGRTDVLVHPASLYFVATQQMPQPRESNFVPTVNIQPGTPHYDWLKPVATVFNIEADIPLTIIASLPGKQLCDVVEIPDTLKPHELKAWQELTIRTASQQEVPMRKRLNLTLEPAWEMMRDPRPSQAKSERLKAWLELASVAEQL